MQKTSAHSSLNPSLVSKSRFARNAARAFTLVEILVVIAIIGILASIGLSVGGSVMEKQLVSRAKGEMAIIMQGLNNYRSRYTEYPAVDASSGEDLTLAMALLAQVSPTGKDISTREDEPFISGDLNFDEDPSNEVTDGAIIDPWGNPYKYFYTTKSDMSSKTEDRNWAYPRSDSLFTGSRRKGLGKYIFRCFGGNGRRHDRRCANAF